MAVETWQTLPKNQESAETIEEAIDRKIQAHNDDVTAHLGENQSIEAHRQSEIIDHKANSVVTDKLKSSEFLRQRFVNSYKDLSGFYQAGVLQNYTDFCSIRALAGANVYSYLAEDTGNFFGTTFDKNSSMIVNAKFSPSTDCRIDIGIGDGSLQTDGQRACFRYEDGALYAYVGLQENSNGTTLEITGINTGINHYYKVDFIVGDRVDYYIDDELVASLDTNLPTADGVSYFFASVRNFDTGNAAIIEFSNYQTTMDI
jgi:hypothetical protein